MSPRYESRVPLTVVYRTFREAYSTVRQQRGRLGETQTTSDEVFRAVAAVEFARN